MAKIRNIIQSAASREIIKTCPDMVVYIDGLPFFLNPYVKEDLSPYTPVNFNDYITAISCNYGVDNFIPSGSVNLSVPNGFKNLFMAPGGGLILQTMSELRIYAKAYFFSENNNSVYRRVFNGMIKSIDYNETNTSIEISIVCVGVLRFLEIMQTDKKPAVSSFSNLSPEVMTTVDHEFNPYQIIANAFQKDLDFEQFLKSSYVKEHIVAPGQEAALMDSIQPWQQRLEDLREYIHVFGYQNPLTSGPQGITEQTENLVTKLITTHTPEMGVGAINLVGGNVVSKLERVRTALETLGYEGYQDLDGSVIIKPPLYNLDCTMVGDTKLPGENLTLNTNPFIIHLSEILGENYMEDETGIRRTRMTVQGNLSHKFQFDTSAGMRHVASFTDINLVRKFGARDEPPKQMSLLGDDNNVSYAFAAQELVKINRGFRTYHVTIPLRPELRLGFPIFIPHLDMYAYISTISLSYNVGGRADMSLTCNYIRKRPQFPKTQTVAGKDILIYSSKPNMIHALSAKPPVTGSIEHLQSAPLGPGIFSTFPSVDTPTSEQSAVQTYLTKKASSIFGTTSDTKNLNWRISEDTTKVFNGDYQPSKTGGAKHSPKVQDTNYIETLLNQQPYTDEKGYEVLSPFAWGRYTTLSEAIFTTTKDPKHSLSHQTPAPNVVDPSISTFLLAGITSLNTKDSSAVSLNTALTKTATELAWATSRAQYLATDKQLSSLKKFDGSNVISFELNFSNEILGDTQLVTQKQKDMATKIANNSQASLPTPIVDPNQLQKATMFLNGISDDMGAWTSGSREKDGPDAVSLQPQNTDLGDYRAPGTLINQINSKLDPKYATTLDKRVE